MTPRTQTFRRGRYSIDILDGPLLGVCETPDKSRRLYLMIPNDDTEKALATIIHEAMHAEGVPDRLIDGHRDSAEHVARLLWRLGWRKGGRA